MIRTADTSQYLTLVSRFSGEFWKREGFTFCPKCRQRRVSGIAQNGRLYSEALCLYAVPKANSILRTLLQLEYNL